MTHTQACILSLLYARPLDAEEIYRLTWKRKLPNSSYGGPSREAKAVHWYIGRNLKGPVERRIEWTGKYGRYAITEEGRRKVENTSCILSVTVVTL